MQCPVCSRPAENLTPNTLDGVVVGCDHCGSYMIQGGAFHEFVGLEMSKRLAALEGASLPRGAAGPSSARAPSGRAEGASAATRQRGAAAHGCCAPEFHQAMGGRARLFRPRAA